MLDLLIYLLLGVVVLVGAVLLLAARQPSSFRYARSLRIAASQERLHGLINDLRKMNTWNPYALRDKSGSATYSGPDSGPGQTFHFAGAGGTGSVSVVDSTPSKVGMRLVMTKPMAGDNRVEFTLKPDGDATEVTWAISGPSSLPGRIFALFVNCERMMGRDFDEGLANLKTIAEAR